MVAKAARKRAEKEPNILIERVVLIAQRLARAEKITADFAVHLQEKTRLGFVIGIIGCEKIGEQFPIFINRIDGMPEKAGFAAQLSDRFAIQWAVAANDERLMIVALHQDRR